MNTINAQTIINEAMAALAVAPDKTGSDFFDKIKIKTSERGHQLVQNNKSNIQKFIDLVRKNAAAFGGGLVRTAKPRPSVSWPANLVALFKQSIEDHDYRAALDIGDRLGALFYTSSKGIVFMHVAPVPCDFNDRVVSVCNEDGKFSVIDPVSMRALAGLSFVQKRTRAAQVENVRLKLESMPSFDLNAAIDKQSTFAVDQSLLRAQWILEHGMDSEAIETRIDAHNVQIEEQASQDVAQVVAQAMAAAAISEAMADTSEDARELVTCEAGESEASAPTAGRTSWAPVPQYVPPVPSSTVFGQSTPPAFRGNDNGDDELPPIPPVAPSTPPVVETKALNYATDGKCHNAQMGTYGHECGKPASWLGTTSKGFVSGFCSYCKEHGHEARGITTWAAIGTDTPPTPSVQKQADTPSVQKADETRKQWQGFAHDIPASLAISAYSGTSFSPERRGASAQNEYGQTMAADYETLRAQAVKGGTLDLLPEVFARYRSRQASSYKAYLSSSSRCVSSFIAGPSNFPAARMNKRADISHKRLTEYLDGGKMALQAAIRTLRPDLRAIMAGDADAIDQLTVKIESAERAQASMKAANKAIRANAKLGEAHQVAALMELGFSERQAIEVIKPDFSGRIGFASYILTNNNANIRRMKERLEQISKAQATEVQAVECANGVTLEDDAPANRVRLYFPGKPDEEIRTELKSSGFRWAPSVGAWQAYRNNGTLATARRMAGDPVENRPEPVAAAEIEATPTVAVSTEAPTPAPVEFLEALADADRAWKDGKESAQAMEKFPRGAMGLILDSAKATPEYLTAKQREDYSIARIKAANTYLIKNFKAEYLAYRAAQRATKMAPTPPAVESQPEAVAPAVETAQDVTSDNVSGWGPAIGERYIGAVEYAVQEANRRGDGFEYRTGENALMERRKLPAVTQASAATQTAPAAPQGQQVKSKSGKWVAWLYPVKHGRFGLTFDRLGLRPDHTVYHFDTARERMTTLQLMARAADAPTDTPPGGGLPCPVKTPIAHALAVALLRVLALTPPRAPAVSSATPGSAVAVRRNIVPDNGHHIVDPAFEAWTFTSGARFAFVMYLGKSAKPWKYYGYITEAKRDEGFKRYAADAREILANKAKLKAESKAQADKPHGLQVGDVVRSSWGYDQTNVNHYQVTAVIGKRTVEVRELNENHESTGGMTGRASPVWGDFAGEPMRRQVDKHGQVNMLSATYGRASKIDPMAIVHGVRCYAATSYSSYA